MPCVHSLTSTQRIKTSLIIKHSHLSALESLKKGWHKVTRHPKFSQNTPKGAPLSYISSRFFAGCECESRQLWRDAGSKSCPSGNVREGLSDGAALKSMRARIMWLISPALALRSEGADQSPAKRAFSLHTERRSTLSHPFTRATPAVCLRQNSASVLK